MAMLKPKMKLQDISNPKKSIMKGAASSIGAKLKSPIKMDKAIKSKVSKGFR